MEVAQNVLIWEFLEVLECEVVRNELHDSDSFPE